MAAASTAARGESEHVRPRPWGAWWGAAGAWTALALLSVTQTALALAHQGAPVRWGHLVAFGLVDWATCAPFVPPLWWLVRRAPLERRTWARGLPLYVGATLAAAVAKYALMVPLVRALLGEPASLGAVLAGNVLTEAMIFFAVVGALHAVEFSRRAREREALALQLRARLSEAQLAALRAQLHPHFLFNTLNTAVTLVHRDPDAADAMLTRLAELLRLTLRADAAHETTLGEELGLLDRYLAIMHVRFADRLAVRRDVPAALLSARVPAFVLQPLVENALEHGVARLDGAGRVDIGARRDGRALVVTVRDDGPGVGEPSGAAADAGPARGGAADSGIGLTNTRRRLAELYGDAAALTLRPAPAGGTEAELRLPFMSVSDASDGASDGSVTAGQQGEGRPRLAVVS